ncbi:2-dehydropantoate 2-reductase [Microaerobacter geothermalis]|uniref:ketopantoate reductase family protein n=1 Tax=Microaerobacter geothermalis TaxID=674972 RepID=UPI001F422ECD|nr:2-dehydropantoate 2-reductase [Microaerobacter geothermalis]MCF6093575.1 2-dehydropantoate 2-reductase [Microaerobacter geothermalis]
MNIAVIGAGAIGMLLASHFARSHQVYLITRTKEQADLIKNQGVVLEKNGAEEIIFPYVYDQEDTCHIPREISYIFLTVKQFHLSGALEAVKRWKTTNETMVIAMQNGMGHEEKLASAFPEGGWTMAVTTEGALKTGRNRVKHTGEGITRMEMDLPEENRLQLEGLFQTSGLSLEWSPDIVETMWKKLLVNCAINPVTGIMEIRNGELLSNPHLLNIMKKIYEEGALVAKKEGYDLSYLWKDITEICRNTFHNESSMLQDIRSGRKTEIEQINGVIVKKGKQYGVSTPANELMVQLILGKETKNSSSDG